MSFNVDDPLAGILSDGSDDSFFDDDIIGKKKPTKKNLTPTLEKKNALFDLDSDKPKATVVILDDKDEGLSTVSKSDSKKGFDFEMTSSTKISKDSFKTEVNSKTVDKLNIMKSPSKNRSASHDTLDILGDLGGPKKETVKPLEKGKSSQSLLDDILGESSKPIATTQARPSTAAKTTGFDFDSILGKSEDKQTRQGRNTPQKPNIQVKNTKEDLAPIKKSSEDWLGIFKDNDENNDEGDDTGMPAWLAGGDTKKKKADQSNKSSSKPEIKEVQIDNKDIEEPIKQREVDQPELNNLGYSKPVPNATLMHASNEDIATEGATLYLQQQESQLMVALQLKAQEEKLAALQMRQKESQRVQREAALAQHSQLDAMLQRQAAHRQQMQAIISAHQERITQRIKDLLGTSDIDQDRITINPDDEVDTGRAEQRETPHMKEKKQLLQLVQSLQENHDKEIDLMETSYRRQLAFLEISLSQSEERMKEESDKLVKFYSEKISWLEEHHQLHKKMTEDNLKEMTERHKAENELVRQQHLENIRVLQEHHVSLMENIKKAVKQEQVLIQDSAGFSSDLHELVKDVKESKSQCQILVETIQTLSENTHKDTERSVQLREMQINDILQQLKRDRENFEIEKTETRDIVKMMESRLKQMTSMIEEDAAAMKQKKMEFEFEKATFSKQTEFAKNLLKKQDEEIKIMRDDIQKEYQEKISKIDEERKKAVTDSAALAKEKASIQSIKQELETLKAELHAQLEEVTEERSKLNIEKQQIHMEEQRILAKSRDLDLLAKTAMDRQSQADKKYSEAEFLQHKYEERIRRIQEHVVSLNTREKQIAREKVALSRERLNLHNDRKQIASRLPCSLCKSSQSVPQYYEPNYIPDAFNLSVTRDVSGPNVEVSSAMNAIEQEMAFLMSRNFSLRHSTGTATSIVHDEGKAEGRGGDNLQSSQPESAILKDYMDPKFMMLRLDVQQVLSNLDQNKKECDDKNNVEE
ncbi:fas-binding factor 1 homolog [Plodia interpunctella]|uniref:fas-binding factor 1 homolog n=1 Tax=Plodia interpunctella TaxID=58824 RepID=UPI002367E558|nr:fas-binding factor 1 homolog [Plodia interpunctella]